MKVGIVGAGPAGLTCARILLQAGISVQIFEREESPHVRSQGGTLDLHPDTGQAALNAAGLLEKFQEHSRHEGEDMVLADRHGKRYAEIRNTARGRPEIDRSVLRQILLDSIPEGTIRWNANLRHAEVGTLHFSQSTESGFDLIIGADGAWSKIRPLLTPVQPFYSGISGVEIRLRDIDNKQPELSKMLGNGNFFVFGEEHGRVLICQRQGDRSVRIYAVGWKPESWINESGIDFSDATAARAAILEDYKDWTPEFKELIQHCDDDIIARKLYMLPCGLRWSSVPGVAILGDAAHVMTPFAGEGVNAAMADAMKLAESIIANQSNLPKAVKDYETWMFAAARLVTQKTWDSLLDRFGEGGTQKTADRINRNLALHVERAKSGLQKEG